MAKKKNKSILISNNSDIQLTLSGKSRESLNVALTKNLQSLAEVDLDSESIILLHSFLTDYLQDEVRYDSVGNYEPTGRAIAIMDSNSIDIVGVHRLDSLTCEINESDEYNTILGKIEDARKELPSNPIVIFFDTYDGSITISVIRRILRACVAYQATFVKTGELLKSRPMVLKDLESFTTIDVSVISRATRNVLIKSSTGNFTLNSSDYSLTEPSLFDEGCELISGSRCSRKAVLSQLIDIINSEDKCTPYVDEDITDILTSNGYDIARRTVAKYRDEILNIPNSRGRKNTTTTYKTK